MRSRPNPSGGTTLATETIPSSKRPYVARPVIVNRRATASGVSVSRPSSSLRRICRAASVRPNSNSELSMKRSALSFVLGVYGRVRRCRTWSARHVARKLCEM